MSCFQPSLLRNGAKPKPSKKFSLPTSGMYHKLGIARGFSLIGISVSRRASNSAPFGSFFRCARKSCNVGNTTGGLTNSTGLCCSVAMMISCGVPTLYMFVGQYEIMKSLDGAKDAPVLLHCASSNRVGYVWSMYRATKHGLSEDAAIDEGKQAGMTAPMLIEGAKKYIEQKQQASPVPEKKP